VRLTLYTAGVRRKPWYPRKKQPRWRAKLGKVQLRILDWIWTWDYALGRCVEPIWERDPHLLKNIPLHVTEGIDWHPRRLRFPASTWDQPLPPKYRAAVSRALRGLEQRGIVERIYYPGTSRTSVVKLTPRGVKLMRSLTAPYKSKLLTD
jgi:hypothetical protein